MSPTKEEAKQELKEWQKAFKEIHKRKPKEADIKGASKKILGLYCKCFPHKSSSVKRVILTNTSSDSKEMKDSSKQSTSSFQLRKPLAPSRIFPLYKKRAPLQDAELLNVSRKSDRSDESISSQSNISIISSVSVNNTALLRRSPRKAVNNLLSPAKVHPTNFEDVMDSPSSLSTFCGLKPKLRRSPRKRFCLALYQESPEKSVFMRQKSITSIKRNVCGLLDKIDNDQQMDIDATDDQPNEPIVNEDEENDQKESPIKTTEKPKRQRRTKRPTDNFIRLNMKKGRFSRAPKKMTGEQAKRMANKFRLKRLAKFSGRSDSSYI